MGLSTAENVDPAYATVKVAAIDARLAAIDEETDRLKKQRAAFAKHLPKKTSSSTSSD